MQLCDVLSRNQILTHDASNNSPDGVILVPAPPISEEDTSTSIISVSVIGGVSVGERYHAVLLLEVDASAPEYICQGPCGYSSLYEG